MFNFIQRKSGAEILTTKGYRSASDLVGLGDPYGNSKMKEIRKQ